MEDEVVRCPACGGSMHCVGEDEDGEIEWMCADCGHVDYTEEGDYPEDLDDGSTVFGDGEDPFDV